MQISKARIEALSTRVTSNLFNADLIENLKRNERVAEMISAVLAKEFKGTTILDRDVNQIMKNMSEKSQANPVILVPSF